MNGEYFDLNHNNKDSSYLDNLIHNNIGKNVDIHIIIPGNDHENILSGILEEASNDYIIISNPTDGAWHMILFIYIAYITFLEPVNL